MCVESDTAEHQVVISGTRTRSSQTTGSIPVAVLLVQVFAVGYYHFLLEVVPRLIIALQVRDKTVTVYGACAALVM